MRTSLLLGIPVLLTGCAVLSRPTLPTVNADFCAGVGLSATLRGDPDDPRVTWLVHRWSHTREEVAWPHGYTARFTPDLEVLDASGLVVAREGELVDGLCTNGGPGRGWISGSAGYRLECGQMPQLPCEDATRAVAGGLRDLSVLTFTSAEGDYRATLDDGTEITGRADPGP